MIRFTDFMLFLSPYIGYMHDTLRIVTYWAGSFQKQHPYKEVRPIFYSNELMICFTDFMIFLSLCIG